MLDPQIRNLLDLFAADPSVKPVQSLAPDAVRERLVQTGRLLGGTPDQVGTVEDRTMPGPASALPLRLYAPVDAGDVLPGIVFFHGGGWVAGNLDSHDTLCRALCHHSGARVVAVDYRLAPEHRFPAAILDAVAALEWVAGHAGQFAIDPVRLAVAGDSAGGNLAAVAAQQARAAGPAVRFQLLIYPVVDTRTDTGSYR